MIILNHPVQVNANAVCANPRTGLSGAPRGPWKTRPLSNPPWRTLRDMVHLMSPADYQPGIQARFETVAARLRRLVPQARIEHVGASSIPGAESKGDLDICLVVNSEDLEETVATLRSAGYVEQPNTLRTNELCMLVWPEAEREHAIQVVAEGSAFTGFIAFRELLRRRPDLVQAYNAVKRAAAVLPDEHYRQRKAVFIESVLRCSPGEEESAGRV